MTSLPPPITLAIARVSPSPGTRSGYSNDARIWLAYCADKEADWKRPPDDLVQSWLDSMATYAPKTRNRRISSLSSIYKELRRARVVDANPFSVDEGPRREKAPVLEPTKLATAAVVRKVLATCDGSWEGIRDAAIVRVLWSTGMRRVSLLSMTMARLDPEPDAWIATVTKKGGDTQRVLIRGSAKAALDLWIKIGHGGNYVWTRDDGSPMQTRHLNEMLARRSKSVGEHLSPHMLRVAFLTFNTAPLEAKQDAAGHADPATTRMYDRQSWRGRAAFEGMPEVDELE